MVFHTNGEMKKDAAMKPREIFGLIVRVFGLSLFFYAIWYLIFGIATVMGLLEEMPGYGLSYFLTGLFFLGFGLYLLRGAPGLMRYSYPDVSNLTNTSGAVNKE
jgi:hypothetical protein